MMALCSWRAGWHCREQLGAPNTSASSKLLWRSSPTGLMLDELHDTRGKSFRKGRKETTHPTQSLLLNLDWKHPHAVDNQEFTASVKPLLNPRPRSCSGHPCGLSGDAHGYRNLLLNKRNMVLVMNIFQRGSNGKGGRTPHIAAGF